MYSDALIEARNISKVYRLYNKPGDRLKQILVPRIKRLVAPCLGGLMPQFREDKPRYHEFWALRDVSISLLPRETLGIIGQNGSGKSTLLQIICGTLSPSSGEVRSRGRIAALLELGAGFNPEFTGRENVYLNASIYGLSASEIDKRMDAIVDFAEIDEHIDQPVKTYSSGMFVRLAFSVIANIDADILVIDEALAVGDAYFQQKCMRFLRKFKEHGSIFFVSHDTGAMMSFCDRVIWLQQGSIRSQGDPKDVCEEYLAYLYQKHAGLTQDADVEALEIDSNIDTKSSRAPVGVLANKEKVSISRGFGDGSVEIYSHALMAENGGLIISAKGGEMVRLEMNFKVHKEINSAIAGFIIKDRLGQYIFGDNTYESNRQAPVNYKIGDVGYASFSFVMPILANGCYTIVLSVASGSLEQHLQHQWLHDAIAFNAVSNLNTGVIFKIPVDSLLQ